jgi:hypothetical protein
MVMANIRAVDFRLLDDIFAIGGGYVLDFSNRTFSDFSRSEIKIDIDLEKYCPSGTSRGKRPRAFLQIEDDKLAAHALFRDSLSNSDNSVSCQQIG